MKRANIKKLNLRNQILKNMRQVETHRYYSEDYAITATLFDNERISELMDWSRASYLLNTHGFQFWDVPTGSGKTTTVLKYFLPLCKKRGKKILCLTPRTSLARAVKEKLGEYDEEAKRIFDTLNEIGINNTYDFGTVEVMTYQSLQSQIDFNENDYELVVFDEIQYIVEDATFNRYTKQQFKFVLEKLKKCGMLFLSATAEEVFDVVYYAVINAAPTPKGLDLIYVERNYADFYNLHFFQDEDFIYQLFKRSYKKFIVFVDSINEGESMMQKLAKCNIRSCFYDADAKEDERRENVNNMISNEDFDEQVVIMTCAYEVGINLNTTEVGVVLFTYTQARFIQELGRKRILNSEIIDVYVNIPTKKKIKSRYDDCKHKLESFNEKKKSLQGLFSGDNLPFPFYCDNGYIEYNSFTIEKWKNNLEFYGELLQHDDFMEHYVEVVKSWLELNDDMTCFFEETDAEDKEMRIRSLIGEFIGRNIMETEFEAFRNSLFEIEDGRSIKRSDRPGGTGTVNNVISKYGFRIESHNKIWQIRRLEVEDNA